MGTLRATISHAGKVVNGVTLGEPATPAWFTYDDPAIPSGTITDDGTVVLYEQPVVDDPASTVNREAIRTAAANALAGNRDFLALASPTNAQTLAQVKDLTRQVNGLARLSLGKLDGTD